jgi:hypothetical protein
MITDKISVDVTVKSPLFACQIFRVFDKILAQESFGSSHKEGTAMPFQQHRGARLGFSQPACIGCLIFGAILLVAG